MRWFIDTSMLSTWKGGRLCWYKILLLLLIWILSLYLHFYYRISDVQYWIYRDGLWLFPRQDTHKFCFYVLTTRIVVSWRVSLPRPFRHHIVLCQHLWHGQQGLCQHLDLCSTNWHDNPWLTPHVLLVREASAIICPTMFS